MGEVSFLCVRLAAHVANESACISFIRMFSVIFLAIPQSPCYSKFADHSAGVQDTASCKAGCPLHADAMIIRNRK